MTLRLGDDDHELLRLACLVSRKSQNVLLTELLRAEVDRVLPGRRRADGAEPDLQAMWKSLGVPRPPDDTAAGDQVRAGLDAAFDDAARFWAERDAQRRGRVA